MKKNRLDYIVLYLIVACFILALAAVTRLFALKEGFDGFSLFIIFVIVIAILFVVYLSIHSFLERLLLPIIGKILSKIPFINKIKAKRYASHIEGSIDVIQAPERLLAEVVDEERSESISKSQAPVLEEIRQTQLQKRALEQEEQINTVVEYTGKAFVLYTSEEDLEVLIQNLHIYINNLDLKELKPIKVKELTINDLRHFGWNIWNHFKPRKQEDIAYFLKVVFPEVFKETEVESIKRHLRGEEKKGVLKIEKDIR